MDKVASRKRRKRSIRKKVFGTTERPRLTVHKSNKYLYAQIIDDTAGRTICGLNTEGKAIAGDAKGKRSSFKDKEMAKKLGLAIAEMAKEQKVTSVVFDRSGYRYHGVVKTLAEAAREGGLEF